MWKEYNFIKEEKLINREFYDFYRANRKKISKSIDQYNYFVKAINGILEIVYNNILENENGVYLEGLGYFCFLTRGKRRKKRKSVFDKKVINDVKYLYFYPEEQNKKIYLYPTLSKDPYSHVDYTPSLNEIILQQEILDRKPKL